jgi:DNA-binding response OmpR family regulator
MGGAQAVWRASAADHFDWRLWDDEAVVYVVDTGVTHSLSPAATGVLVALLQRPGQMHTEPELLCAVDGDVDLTAASAQADLGMLREVLASMQVMGLVERSSLALAS